MPESRGTVQGCVLDSLKAMTQDGKVIDLDSGEEELRYCGTCGEGPTVRYLFLASNALNLPEVVLLSFVGR